MVENNNDKHLTKATEEKQEDVLIENQQINKSTQIVDLFETVLGNKSAYLMVALLLALLMILFGG